MEYKIDDKVQITLDRTKLREIASGYVSFMENFLGKTCTICQVTADFQYKLLEDTGRFWWSSDVFEGYSPEIIEGQVQDYTKIEEEEFEDIEEEIPLTEEERLALLDELEDGKTTDKTMPTTKKVKKRVPKKVEAPKNVFELIKAGKIKSGTYIKSLSNHRSATGSYNYKINEIVEYVTAHSSDYTYIETDAALGNYDKAERFVEATKEEIKVYLDGIKNDPSKQKLKVTEVKDILWTMLLEHYGEKRIDRQNESSSRVDFYIHYPEFVIKNSEGASKTLKDLYVKLCIQNDSTKWYLSSFYGARTTFEYTDYICYYQHSHLSSGQTPGFMANWCVGDSTPMSIKTRIQLRDDGIKTVADLEEFDSFLHLLDSYVQWESLEGGPHVAMKTVKLPSSQSYSNTILSEKTKEFFKVVSSLPIKVVDSGDLNILQLQNTLLEKYIKDTKVFNVCLKQPNGSYVDINTQANGLQEKVDEINKKQKPLSNFRFQGKTLPVVVYLEEKKAEEIDEDSLFPPKQLTDYIAQEINKKISNFSVKARTTKMKLKTEA